MVLRQATQLLDSLVVSFGKKVYALLTLLDEFYEAQTDHTHVNLLLVVSDECVGGALSTLIFQVIVLGPWDKNRMLMV